MFIKTLDAGRPNKRNPTFVRLRQIQSVAEGRKALQQLVGVKAFGHRTSRHQSRRTVNQLTDLFWSALHGLQSITLAEATQLLTEHSVANGIGALVAAQGVPEWVAGLRDLSRSMRRRAGAMLSRPLSDNRLSPNTCRGRESMPTGA